MTKEEFLQTKEELLAPKKIETYVEGVGKVLYRRPTQGDQLQAELNAREHPLWKEMSEDEKRAQVTTELIKLIIEEPGIFTSKFKELDLALSNAVIDVISLELAEYNAELLKKRRNRVQNFLEKRREELSQMLSIPSLRPITSTLTKQEKSS